MTTPSKKSALYAQSGGVTAVINASACGVIETANHLNAFDKVYAARNGILGVLHEELIDTSLETPQAIRGLYHTPGGAFGSCRYKLKSFEQSKAEYERLIEVFKAHNIGYFFYNGGGDSQDTAFKVSKLSQELNYPLVCIGIPKTIDNDLPITDNCPGFGSVAKYVAVSIREAGLDVASMASSSTKVFILEVMGRHTGWIAAASGLATESLGQPPHLILFPEIPFDELEFCQAVEDTVQKFGYCTIVAAEGIKDSSGKLLSESGSQDAFGHKQLGGVAPVLAQIIKQKLNLKYHYAISDYLQRSARHIASKTDLEQAYALGKAAVEFALTGKNNVLPILIRENQQPYRWKIGETSLESVANIEKHLPKEFIAESNFHITSACREYLLPLIQGESYPPYQNGLPAYITLKNQLIPKKLPDFQR